MIYDQLVAGSIFSLFKSSICKRAATVTPLSSRLNRIKANPNNIWRPLSQSSSPSPRPSRSAIDELSVHLSWMEMIYGTFFWYTRNMNKNSTRVLLFSFFFYLVDFWHVLQPKWYVAGWLSDSRCLMNTFHHFFILINWIISESCVEKFRCCQFRFWHSSVVCMFAQ